MNAAGWTRIRPYVRPSFAEETMWKTFSNGSAFCRRTVLRVGALWLSLRITNGKVEGEGGVCVYRQRL